MIFIYLYRMHVMTKVDFYLNFTIKKFKKFASIIFISFFVIFYQVDRNCNKKVFIKKKP